MTDPKKLALSMVEHVESCLYAVLRVSANAPIREIREAHNYMRNTLKQSNLVGANQ